MPIPIRTPRLRVRPFTLDDAEAMFRVWGDAEVMRYIPREPAKSVDEIRERLSRSLSVEREPGMGVWAIARPDDDVAIGMAGLGRVEWKGPDVEVAYHLARDAWGRGYATEVAGACVRYGFDELGLDRIIGLTFPENVASQRVLEKIGMKKLGLTSRYYQMEMVELEICKPGLASP
jgi:ribosomal-protein-alanine N-acetyltransferase